MNKIIEQNLWDVMSLDENKKAFIKEMINFVINNLKDAFGYCCRNELSLKEYCPKERFGGNSNQATVFATVRLAEMWENGCYESLRNLFGMKEIDIKNVKRWTTSDGDFIIFNEVWELKTSQAKDSWTGATHSSHKSKNYILINFTLNWDLKLRLITPPEFIPKFAVYLVKFPNNIEINEIWKGEPTNKNSFTTFKIRNDWIHQGYVRKLHGNFQVRTNSKYAKIIHHLNPLIDLSHLNMKINWFGNFNSTNIKRIGYNDVIFTIFVNFMENDNIYFWQDCSKKEFERFCNSKSKNKFIDSYLNINKGDAIKL